MCISCLNHHKGNVLAGCLLAGIGMAVLMEITSQRTHHVERNHKEDIIALWPSATHAVIEISLFNL